MRAIATILLATTALWSAPALAQSSQTAPDAEATDDPEAIIVYGKGETRQVQELDNRALTILAPGTSPLKAIEKLPSVNFQSADPFGLYEWSQRVSIRSFSQTQIGFTLDGIPLGDGTYGNNNGLHISRAIIPDNIGITRVSQGAGSIGTQATNNLGGTIEFFSLDPKGELGLDVNLTYGSENTKRGFARINAGTPDGIRGFVSAAWIDAGKWKGDGKQRQYIGNAKVVIPVGDTVFDAYFSYSDRAEQDYQDLSLEQIRRLGYGSDNLFPNYALALRIADIANNIDTRNNVTGAPGPDGLSDVTGNRPTDATAGTTFPAPYTNIDDAYYDASGLRQDALGSIGITAPLSEAVTFKAKAYYHDNKGQGTWFTPYVPSPNGVPISVRTTEYNIRRGGVFGSVDAKFGNYELTVGGWYENNDFRQARRFYALTSRTDPGRDALKFMRGSFFTQWDFNFSTDTLQYYVRNKLTFGPATINLGWKGFNVENKSNPIIQGPLASGDLRSRDWFQPHAGIAVSLTDNAELFAGFTQVTRAFVSSATSGPFSTSQTGFNAIRTTLKPEESDTYELGARYNNSRFNGSVGAYYVNFRNRLLGFAPGAGIVGNPSVLQNVGNVRSYGFEAAGDFRIGYGFTLFASYAYNDSTYQNDVFNALNVRVAATKGKTTVDSPQHLLRGEIGYESGGLFGRLAGNYISRRFFTYENDQSVPGRVLVDATLGYRFDLGLSKPVEIQLNATNLFDLDYVATIGSNGFGNRGDNQTLLAGAPQQFFVTLKAGF